MMSRVPLAAVVVVVPAIQAAAPAHAAAPATGFESLRTAAGKGEVKIWSRLGAFSFERAQFDSTGIWSSDASVYRSPRKAWIQTAEVDSAGRVPRPIGWEAVDSVAVVREEGMPGAVRGGIFLGGMVVALFSGLVAGYLVYSGQDAGLAAWVAPVTAGVAIGVAVTGGEDHVEVVYRANH
jgi:hypothetical protein